jgi:hypothetical protein
MVEGLSQISLTPNKSGLSLFPQSLRCEGCPPGHLREGGFLFVTIVHLLFLEGGKAEKLVCSGCMMQLLRYNYALTHKNSGV